MAIIKKTKNNEGWQGCGEKETLVHLWWICKLAEPLREIVQRFHKKLKIDLTYYPAIPCLSIYPKKTKTLIRQVICNPLFTATLFTIVNNKSRYGSKLSAPQ